ncbi:MAG TPA: hypothetical protein VGT04_00425 [Acidobacteriaceae bacterium]|nr:hypothetical protein [Acidobacteriaceae bacterium]
MIKGRESFTCQSFDVLEKALRDEPEITEGEIDRVLTTRALSEMSGMVKRIVSLSKLDPVRVPSEQTSVYVREAARTYAHGLFQASAAISRAALEQAIKEVLGLQGGKSIWFQNLLKRLKQTGSVEVGIIEEIGKTAEKANRVIHERPTDGQGAFEILFESRALIVQVYSAKRVP